MFLLPLNQAQSDDENLRDEDFRQHEEKKSGESKDKTDEVFNLRNFCSMINIWYWFLHFYFQTKVRKPKRHNPFMPRVKVTFKCICFPSVEFKTTFWIFFLVIIIISRSRSGNAHIFLLWYVLKLSQIGYYTIRCLKCSIWNNELCCRKSFFSTTVKKTQLP